MSETHETLIQQGPQSYIKKQLLSRKVPRVWLPSCAVPKCSHILSVWSTSSALMGHGAMSCQGEPVSHNTEVNQGLGAEI